MCRVKEHMYVVVQYVRSANNKEVKYSDNTQVKTGFYLFGLRALN